MAISVGDKLPDADLMYMGPDGPQSVGLSSLLSGRKVVIFGLPGAFSRTCSAAHVPSFLRAKDGFAAKGVDEIICISVNDPFVMGAWAESSGAKDGGLKMLADASGAFTKAVGMDFDAPPVGFFGRSKRYALLAEDGVIKVLNVEEGPGECTVSAGEALLEAI